MVNFHDPVVIANEAGACAPRHFLSKSEYNQVHLPEETKRLWSLANGIFMWACLSH